MTTLYIVQLESAGRAHGQDQERQQGDDAAQQQQDPAAAQPMEGMEQQQDAAPDMAPNAQQSATGLASATQRSAPAPITGGGSKDASAAQQKQKKQAGGQRDPNPLRNLGDALERWRADLAVQHEAPPPPPPPTGVCGHVGVWGFKGFGSGCCCRQVRRACARV